MAHGSTRLYASGQSRMRHPAWRAALRRGVILGSVAALHLATVALVLRPMPYRSARSAIANDDEALHLSFVARSASPPPRALRPRVVHPATWKAAPLPPSAATPPHTVVLTRPASTSGGPGDYRSAVLGTSQPAPHVNLPGADAPLRTGIQLRTAPSLQQVVRVMTTASRCKYERMKMERSANQFVTRQLVERALDADGCGPQATHATVDATVDAISRRAILDD